MVRAPAVVERPGGTAHPADAVAGNEPIGQSNRLGPTLPWGALRNALMHASAQMSFAVSRAAPDSLRRLRNQDICMRSRFLRAGRRRRAAAVVVAVRGREDVKIRRRRTRPRPGPQGVRRSSLPLDSKAAEKQQTLKQKNLWWHCLRSGTLPAHGTALREGPDK